MNATDKNTKIGNEILNQLGGYNKLNAMLGLKDCMINGAGISFKIKVAAAANYVKIQLNEALDLYEVEIGKLRGMNYKIVKSLSGVYSDMLKDLIENTCKVRLSL